MTSYDRNRILRRQNDLTLNMTRASNSNLQRGVFSSVTQFTTYHNRLLEQFVSPGRLVGPDGKSRKLRAVATYSFLYGVPVGVGAPVGYFYPLEEDIRTKMLEQGIEPNDAATKALMNGFVSAALELATGAEMNVGERYGPGGLGIWRDIFAGDLDTIEIVLGASGSILNDTLKTMEPAIMGAADVFSEDAYPLLPEDFLNIASNISTVNNAMRAYYGLNAHKYITKNQIPLDDVTTTEALLSGILGLTPQRISDTFLKMQSMKTQNEAQKEARNQIIRNIRLGLKSDDPVPYFRAARIWLELGGFPVSEHGRLFADAMDQEDLYQQINNTFWRNAPPAEAQKRFDAILNDRGSQ